MLKTLVVGCGNMGSSHARAYEALAEFEIVGLVSKGLESAQKLNHSLIGEYPCFSNYEAALAELKPDIVNISTYPDTHESFAIKAFEAGAHVFLEKPIAPTLSGCLKVKTAASQHQKKCIIGYILRQHPTWQRFISEAQKLGKPLVMRMNLNQQSQGKNWLTHLNLLKTASPLVDCGVHYVDIMCQMTQAKAICVSAIGVNLSEQVAPSNYNYGQLQVKFDDGSVGWYEAGWGPMISETAFFIKDVFGPKGAVSIRPYQTSHNQRSDTIEAHTQAECLILHNSSLDSHNHFSKPDTIIQTESTPNHDELCLLEQRYLLKCIQENIDTMSHLDQAIESMKIVLAADESIRTGASIHL